MQLKDITVSPIDAMNIDDAKAFLRILSNDDDNLIKSMIQTVAEHAQDILNRQLTGATFELYADDFISKLPKNPIKDIVKIEYMDSNYNYVELDASTYYLYENFEVGCINYSLIPSLPEHKQAVKITFNCGYEAIPSPIQHFMKVKLSTIYENREEYVIGTIVGKFDDKFTDSLISSYRIRP